MIEPTLALQTVIRAALLAAPDVLALVPADNIRAGSTRPDELPCVCIGSGVAEVQGEHYTRHLVARVVTDVHVWALEDGLDRAKVLGAAVTRALMEPPAREQTGFDLETFRHVRTVWPRDPEPAYGHGVLTVEAIVRVRL